MSGPGVVHHLRQRGLRQGMKIDHDHFMGSKVGVVIQENDDREERGEEKRMLEELKRVNEDGFGRGTSQ